MTSYDMMNSASILPVSFWNSSLNPHSPKPFLVTRLVATPLDFRYKMPYTVVFSTIVLIWVPSFHWYQISTNHLRMTSLWRRDVARLFKRRRQGRFRGEQGGWPRLKMAALHRPLYKVSFHGWGVGLKGVDFWLEGWLKLPLPGYVPDMKS